MVDLSVILSISCETVLLGGWGGGAIQRFVRFLESRSEQNCIVILIFNLIHLHFELHYRKINGGGGYNQNMPTYISDKNRPPPPNSAHDRHHFLKPSVYFGIREKTFSCQIDVLLDLRTVI